MRSVPSIPCAAPAPTPSPKPEELAARLWHVLRLADDALFRAKDACEGFPREAINTTYIHDQLERVARAVEQAGELMVSITVVQTVAHVDGEPIYVNDRYTVADRGAQLAQEQGGAA